MGRFEVLIAGMSFTECPRWRDGRLYFSDFYTGRVMAVGLDGTAETIVQIAGIPAGLGFLPDGRMIFAEKRERKVWRREPDGSLVVHADLSGLVANHLNEMIVDSDGRAWAGNYGFDLDGGAPIATTVMICVEPDGSARVVADGLVFPNGTVLSADGKTLIVAETFGNRLSAFEVTSDRLGERRDWARFGDLPATTDVMEVIEQAEVVPDGICMDAEGAVWVADVAHHRVIRVAEGGAILEDIPTEGIMPFACMLGGDDGRTLFVCVAESFVEEVASAQHKAAIWWTRVGVGHAGTP